MDTGKEIRGKIRSVENTQKITKAMEMVAASKMRKAQEWVYSARPYSEKIRNITSNLSQSNSEYTHPFMTRRSDSKNIGFIVITTDKGLCGSINTNSLRLLILKLRELEGRGNKLKAVAIGNKGLSFLHRIGIKVVAHAVQLGDTPQLEKLIGPVKVFLDAYREGCLDTVYLVYSKFISTMKQESILQQLLPLSSNRLEIDKADAHNWDYIYEPDAQSVIDELLVRYVEALIYQALTENMASEQSARMVAMRSASDNASNMIDELRLVYNKTRQASITRELSEIVAGAAVV